MTRRYLLRIAGVAALLALILGAILWFRPARSHGEKWRFFRLGQASVSAPGLSSPLVFLRVDSQIPDLDSISLLPGGLAFLPKKEAPLFGQRAAVPNAVVDVILEPGKCLLVRRLQLIQPPAAGRAGRERVLISIDEASRLTSASAALRAALPAQCGTGYQPECQVSIWAEARPKKCA